MGKTKNAQPDFKLLTSGLGAPTTWGARYKKKLGYTLAELRPLPRKGSNKQFIFFLILKIADLVQRPTAATVT